MLEETAALLGQELLREDKPDHWVKAVMAVFGKLLLAAAAVADITVVAVAVTMVAVPVQTAEVEVEVDLPCYLQVEPVWLQITPVTVM